jgi:hypothetical protein
VRIPVRVDAYLPVTAAELTELIRADLDETVVELRRAIDSAGIEPADLAAIYPARRLDPDEAARPPRTAPRADRARPVTAGPPSSRR